jgi:hypothetical protein
MTQMQGAQRIRAKLRGPPRASIDERDVAGNRGSAADRVSLSVELDAICERGLDSLPTMKESGENSRERKKREE